MHLRRFRGRRLPDVMRRIREELGPDAVILHTRTTRGGGVLGLFGGSGVEIVAAVDPTPAAPAAERASWAAPAGTARPRGGAPAAAPRPPAPRAPRCEARAGDADAPAAPSGAPAAEAAALHRDVAEVRELLIRLGGPQGLPPALGPLYQRLVDGGVDETLAFRVTKSLPLADEEGRLHSAAALWAALRRRLGEMLRVDDVPAVPAAGVVAVVGSTGAGKTSTLSKLAVRSHLAGRHTEILSLDGMNLGAPGHLDAISTILGIPCALLPSREEVAAELGRGPRRGLLLLDTPGLNPGDAAEIREIGGLLALARPAQIHLVLSATTKAADGLRAARAFAALGVTHLLFTHLDETTSYGSLLTIAVESGLPLSYFGTGREVPIDIRPASADELLRHVLRGDHTS
jgi:flagellar biosynthesis protein FlhF